MGAVEINRIKVKLHKMFDEFVSSKDDKGRETEAKFLTRALAAYILVDLTGCTPEAAGESITDGFNDNGIDALYCDRSSKRLYFVTTSWHETGRGSIDEANALKFVKGFNLIVRDFDLSSFNEAITSRTGELDEAVRKTDTQFVLAVGHTGTQEIHANVLREITKVQENLNDVDPHMVSFESYAQSRIYESAMGLAAHSDISLEIKLLHFGRIAEPYPAYYGQVVLSDVADWKKYGDSLFDYNLRRIIPGSEVNERIRATITNESQHFWYFNNGITILCQSIEKERLGGDRTDSGNFHCKGVSVINGAQTVGSIWDALGSDAGQVLSPTVHLRLIDLRSCPSGFGSDVTRATNTQNRILGRDFAALDPVQVRIAKELDADNVKYTYQTGDESPSPDKGCDIVDATVALACAHHDVTLAVLAKREVGVLWDDIQSDRGRYRSLFNENLEATHLWRAVKILRTVDDALKNTQTVECRPIAVHGNRLIAHLVFQDPEIKKFRDMRIDESQLLARAEAVAREVLPIVSTHINDNWPDSYPQPTFKNATKCRAIVVAVGEIRRANGTTESESRIPSGLWNSANAE